MPRTEAMNAPFRKHASAAASLATNPKIGVFGGPLRGLRYQAPTVAGAASDQGESHYSKGETVSLLRGDLVLGAVEGAPRLNLAQPANRVAGDVGKLRDQLITNFARLVHPSSHRCCRPNHRRS